MLLAIIHKANPDILKEHTRKLYGINETYDFMFELAKVFAPDKIGEIRTIFQTIQKGKPKLKAIPISNKEAEKFFKVIIKYLNTENSQRDDQKLSSNA